jgi:hypothetical protein
LKDQISLLKNQLDLANHREKALMQHIEDLTHRIEFKGQLEQPKTEVEEHKVAPPVHSEMTENPRLEPGQKDDGLTTPVETENKRIPVPEQVEPEQPKRGWLSRFFLPNG